MTNQRNNSLRLALVVPHIFMHRDILPQVIFSPGKLAIALAEGLAASGTNVTLLTPGPITTTVNNITADLSYFEQELALRGDTYLELLKKHPFTFITLARQVQAELIAKAFALANSGQFDVVHVYTNEEDIALPFAQFCKVPVVFTHHDPFNFLVKYKNVFPKYKHLNWISMSYAQRQGMPAGTNWVGNIYHGLDLNKLQPNYKPNGDYAAYLGRIIEPKGVHLAIAAVTQYNRNAKQPLRLKIAGKHYAGHKKDTYWSEKIEPELGKTIEYVGFLQTTAEKQRFLGNAQALLVPSLFDEPFGMVSIEALACGTPVIGLHSGAIPEVIDTKTGIVIAKKFLKHTPGKLNETAAINALATAIQNRATVKRTDCRATFEARFSIERMCQEHQVVYNMLIGA